MSSSISSMKCFLRQSYSLLLLLLVVLALGGCGLLGGNQGNVTPTVVIPQNTPTSSSNQENTPAARQNTPTASVNQKNTPVTSATRESTPVARQNTPVAGPTVVSGGSSPLSGVIFGADTIVSNQNRSADSALVSQMHIQVTTLWLYTDNFTRRNTGPINTRQLSGFVDSYQQAVGSNVQLTVHVMPPRPANCQPGQSEGCKPMSLPADMNLWDSNLTLLAQTLRGQVKYYSIGNEVSSLTWAGSPSDYYDILLPQSSAAIKKGDPSALILDSAEASESYGLVIGQDLVGKGQTQQAVDFMNAFYQPHSGPINSYLPLSAGNINTLLNSDLARGAIPYSAPRFSASVCQAYDVFELHYYAPWSLFQQTIDWIHSQMVANNCVKPIQVWELGYGWENPSTYNISDHANAVTKLLTIAAANNINVIIYFPFSSRGTYAQPLVSSSGPGQPATAYQVAAAKLSGATAVEKLNFSNSSVSGYRFTVSGKNTYVVWSNTGVTVNLKNVGFAGTQATVTNASGVTTTADPSNVSVGATPVIID